MNVGFQPNHVNLVLVCVVTLLWFSYLIWRNVYHKIFWSALDQNPINFLSNRECRNLRNIPDARSCVPCAFGSCEEHNIIMGTASDGSVLGPVVGKIMDKFPTTSFDNGFPDGAVRVVWRGDNFDVPSILFKVLGITCPLIEPWSQKVCRFWVALQPENKTRRNRSDNQQERVERTNMIKTYPCIDLIRKFWL